ncbi:MAG: hypothetical protein P8Q97_00320 [Myxococcota bacterium]|mgnify:CR=1 FL=1|jgi:type II pantothenate kinase|nr:hypothetical protein [Myxococcota bacterium]
MTPAQTPTEKVTRAIGVDVGATLAKLAFRAPGGALEFALLPAAHAEAVAARVRAFDPDRVGLTGCGASALEARLGMTCRQSIEFEAWGRGSRSLLGNRGLDDGSPYLLVSVGTGTSVLRVEGTDVARVGGTALGGGTLMGLSSALTGKTDYEEICRLAERGDRGRVDLQVADLYSASEIGLPGETTAAAFGKLSRPESEAPSVEDLSAAILGLVGENVALIGCGIAYATGVRRLVYGGGTLHDNPALVSLLHAVTSMAGCEPILLEHGSFAGAVGALESAGNS